MDIMSGLIMPHCIPDCHVIKQFATCHGYKIHLKEVFLETFKIMKNPEATGRILQGTQARAGAVTRTAAEPYNIAVERARLDIRKHSFTGRVPERWNKLPASVKSSETIQIFKTAMKKYTSFS